MRHEQLRECKIRSQEIDREFRMYIKRVPRYNCATITEKCGYRGWPLRIHNARSTINLRNERPGVAIILRFSVQSNI